MSLYIDISRRCYEIALLDDNVSEQDRISAWKLGEAADMTLRQNLTHDPKALADLERAKQALIDQGRKFGNGSLVRMLDRQPKGTDPFSFAMISSNRSLVGAYLEAAFTEGRTDQLRIPFIRELIRQSNYGGSNAVLILHGLAAKRDPAVLGLFSHEEYKIMLQSPDNYQPARSILVGLGLLPPVSGARSFKELATVSGFMGMVLMEAFEEADQTLKGTCFTESEEDILSLAARFLYIDLAASQLSQIFGSSHAYKDFKAAMSKPEISRVQIAFSETRNKIYRDELGSISLDTGLLLAAMTVRNVFPDSEAEFEKKKAFLSSGTDWLNNLRVPFLEYLRFILRAMASPIQNSQSSEDEELLRILAAYYRENGARSAIAENAMNFEDWIGSSDQ